MTVDGSRDQTAGYSHPTKRQNFLTLWKAFVPSAEIAVALINFFLKHINEIEDLSKKNKKRWKIKELPK
jgi:hypothetical protein